MKVQRAFRVVFLAIAILVITVLAAIAQSSSGLPTPTVATYTTGAASFLTGITPIVEGLVGFGAACLAIFYGPKILKKMVGMFAK